ncbi:MAG: CdaR family protein [Bacteroidaceae bacterium]|nr:CdaR family protein [Bacteroidaceae bacterium]
MQAHENIFRWLWQRFRLTKINHELWVFIVFVCIAVAFWFIQVLKDQTSINIEYQLELKDLPGSVIITSSVPETVNVTVQGRGYALLEFMIKHKNRSVQIEYSDVPHSRGVFTIDNYVWRKAFAKEFNQGVTLASVNPSIIEIYTSTGDHKQIPVMVNGNIKTQEQYQLCAVNVQPQYVDIYAPSEQFDTIRSISTEMLSLNALKDTTVVRVALNKPKGVKCVPDSVTVTACVDLFTSKTVKVPIYCENIPDDKILRTFPVMAEVAFSVSATMYPNITSDDFVAIVDYNSIHPNDKKCRLMLKGHPEGISNVKLMPEYLDYIIEQSE